MIAGVVALVVVVVGAGIGIWRYQDWGASSTPNAAANEVPNPGRARATRTSPSTRRDRPGERT